MSDEAAKLQAQLDEIRAAWRECIESRAALVRLMYGPVLTVAMVAEAHVRVTAADARWAAAIEGGG